MTVVFIIVNYSWLKISAGLYLIKGMMFGSILLFMLSIISDNKEAILGTAGLLFLGGVGWALREIYALAKMSFKSFGDKLDRLEIKFDELKKKMDLTQH